MEKHTTSALVLLALSVSTLAFSGSARAQQAATPLPSPDASQKSSSGTAAQQLAQNDQLPQPNQQLSLGELARLARARKKDETKATKVINDENSPRGGIYIGGSAPDSSSSSSKSGTKLVLLDFWASWCGPCRESLPDLKQLQSAYSSDQLQVISVSEDRDEGTWNNFVAQNQMTWEQRFDAGGEEARRYGVTGFPTYILMDSSGTVLQRYQGEDPQQSLASRIGPDVKKAQEPKQTPPAS